VRGAGGEELSGGEGCRLEVELCGRISKAVCNELAAHVFGRSGMWGKAAPTFNVPSQSWTLQVLPL
jgi:hypothetical protein